MTSSHPRQLHDHNAERSVLGGILLENAALEEVLAAPLAQADFYSDAHSLLFGAMVALAQAKTPIDTITLRDALIAAGQLQRVGGDDYVLGLTNTIPLVANIVAHAKTVRALAAQRAIVLACKRVIAEAEGGVEDVPDFIDRAGSSVRAACERVAEVAGESLSLGEAALEAVRACTETSSAPRLSLGLHGLDESLGGVEAGNLIVVAADTGVGKSSLVLRMATGMADFVPVGIVSCEDARGILGSRAAAQWSGVSSTRMRTCADEGDMAKLRKLAQNMPAPAIHLEIQIGKTEDQVLAAMKRLVQRHGARVLFVDYVQCVLSRNPNAPRKDQVRDMAARLKGQAADLGVPLVLVSQLSRPPGGDETREPSIHHLKETGDLENSAEVILLLWRTDANDPDAIGMRIGKSKWGARRRLFMLRRNRAGVLEESAATATERRSYAAAE